MAIFNARRVKRQLERREAGLEAAYRDKRRTARFARTFGVTAAGLEFLARLVADPLKARKRNAEHVPLLAKGLILHDPNSPPYPEEFVITPAGRAIVHAARELGW